MASNNVKQIVRSNLNLKPWILSKKPTDIVNSYVQKLYQQIPNDLKNDMVKPRIDVFKLEPQMQCLKTAERFPFSKANKPKIDASLAKAPMRKLKTSERFSFGKANQPKSKLQAKGYHSPSMTAKNSFVAAPKKVIKTPNFKIYNTRKFGSVASSSNNSFLRGNYEERRKQMYKPAHGIQFRTFAGSAAIPVSNYNPNPHLSEYIAPVRLYNELSKKLQTLEITNIICKDLLPVNESIKKKFCVVKPKIRTAESLWMTDEDVILSSFKGRYHPSVTAPPVIKKPLTAKQSVQDRDLFSVGLIKQKAHGGKVNQVKEISIRRENARHQVANEMPCCSGARSSYYGKSSEISNNMRVEKINQQARRIPVEFTCGNRTARSVRGCYPRSFKKVSQTFRKF